jgi:hypothetical protein
VGWGRAAQRLGEAGAQRRRPPLGRSWRRAADGARDFSRVLGNQDKCVAGVFSSSIFYSWSYWVDRPQIYPLYLNIEFRVKSIK